MNLTEATIKALENKLVELKTIGSVIGDYITINGGYTESQYETGIYGFILFRQKLNKQDLDEIKDFMISINYKDIDELVSAINKQFGPVDFINVNAESYNPHKPISYNIS